MSNTYLITPQNDIIDKSKPLKSKIKNLITIKVNEGITRLNLITFFYATWVTICAFVFINAATPYILEHTLNIDDKKKGTYIGDLLFYNEFTIIILSYGWGTLSDKIGRRYVYVGAFMIMCIAVMLHPFCTSFMHLVIFRVIFATGAAASSGCIISLLADYPSDEGKGRSGGVVGLAGGLGAVVALFLFLRIPSWTKLDNSAGGIVMFVSFGGLLAVSSIYLFFGLSSNLSNHMSTELKVIIIEGLKASKNPKIALSYLSSFAARGDSVIITSFLVLWIQQYETAKGHPLNEAIAKAGMLSGIAQTFALIGAIPAGYMADRVDKSLCQVISATVAAIGYFLLSFIPEPEGVLMFVAVIIVGFGEIGMVVSSQVLLSSEAPTSIRGAVSGFFTLSGSIAILTITKVGGTMYDHWKPAPFFILAIVNCTVIITGIVVYILSKRHVKKDDNTFE